MAKSTIDDETLERLAIVSATLGGILITFMGLSRLQPMVPFYQSLTLQAANAIVERNVKADDERPVTGGKGKPSRQRILVWEETYIDPETGEEKVWEHGVTQKD